MRPIWHAKQDRIRAHLFLATLFGKTLLFTDSDDRNNAEIVRGNRAQHDVECALRTVKCQHRIALRPRYR